MHTESELDLQVSRRGYRPALLGLTIELCCCYCSSVIVTRRN